MALIDLMDSLSSFSNLVYYQTSRDQLQYPTQDRELRLPILFYSWPISRKPTSNALTITIVEVGTINTNISSQSRGFTHLGKEVLTTQLQG